MNLFVIRVGVRCLLPDGRRGTVSSFPNVVGPFVNVTPDDATGEERFLAGELRPIPSGDER